MRFADVIVGRFDREAKRTHLRFETPKRAGASLYNWGHLLVELRGEALQKWSERDLKCEGAQRLEDGRFLIARPNAQIVGPPLERGEFGTIHVQFVPDGRRPTGARVFELDLIELDDRGERLGGQRLLLKTGSNRKHHGCDGAVGSWDGVSWRPVRSSCGCGCG